MLLIATGISALFFILLKYLFPQPDFFSDSNNYVLWALYRFNVAYRPTGYSFFLRFIHWISDGSLFTVYVQYLFFFLSSLFCFFSVDYLVGIPQKWRWPVLLFVLLNPMLLFQNNLISSDSLFCSTTVMWVTLCFWVVKRHSWLVLLMQVLFLYLSFELRYAAMFYPVVATVAFLCSSSSWKYKLSGIVLTIGVVFFSVQRQRELNKEVTSTGVFSGFSGWQIANNALYCYRYIDVDVNDLPSYQMQILDRLVDRYIDTVEVQQGEIGSAYIWHKLSPLKLYCRTVEHKTHVLYSSAWFDVSPLFYDYGWYIVKTFPGAYARYYLLPNTIKFFYPDKEALDNYNSEEMADLPAETKTWFPDVDGISCRVADLQKGIVSVFPGLSLLLNVFNIGVLFWFGRLLLKKWKTISKGIRAIFLIWGVFYFTFVVFSIFATAVNLRFMDPVFVLGVIVPFALLSLLQQNKGRMQAA